VPQLVHAPVELDDVEVHEGRQQPSSRGLIEVTTSKPNSGLLPDDQGAKIHWDGDGLFHLKEAGKHARTGWMAVVNSSSTPPRLGRVDLIHLRRV
jgi:hypothetical protein